MSALFNEIIYRPLLNLAVFFYTILPGHDLGVAIIVLTIVIRAILMPLSLRALRSQRKMSLLAPKLEELKQKHKDDNAAQGAAMMALYKEHNINPLGGCLPLLIQIPVLIGLYRVFMNVFKPESLQRLYSFIPDPGAISHTFLGILDIASKNHGLAILAGILQYLQALFTNTGQTAQNTQMKALNTQMLYFFPVMIVVVSWNLPAGLALYWCTATLFSIGEQWYARRTV